MTSYPPSDAADGLSGVDIEISMSDVERAVEAEDDGDETETGGDGVPAANAPVQG